MFDLTNQPGRRTVIVKLSGDVTPRDMVAFADAYRRATDIYEGTPHVVLMDVRGLWPLEAAAQALLEAALRYGRQRGVMRCARLVDVRPADSGWEPWAAHLEDEVGVECASVQEAQEQLRRARAQLFVPVADAA